MRARKRWSTIARLLAGLFFIGGCRAGDCPAGSFRVENQCLQIEEANCAEPVVLYRDVDEDGFGDPLEVTAGCSKTGFVDRGGDCDDTVASTHPDAPEQCNDVDDDCDGVVDDDPETLSWFPDLDGDGFGAQGPIVESCLQPEGMVSNVLDCDDENGAVSPVAQEMCNGLDENCSGMADDGPLMECAVGEVVDCTTECGSLSTTVCADECQIDTCPPPAESCNLVDDDCDGAIDNGVSALVGLGSIDLPFVTPSTEYVHTLKAVSTSNGIVVFALIKRQTEYRLYGYRLSDDGEVVEGPVRSVTRGWSSGLPAGPLDVAVAGNVAYVAMPPNSDEPTFGGGPELVRVSLVDLREVDSVGVPFLLGFVVWESHCIAATETGVAWGHRFTSLERTPSTQALVQFYGPSLEEGEGYPLRSVIGDGSDVPQCAISAATGAHEGKWVIAYDASPYVELAVLQADVGDLFGKSLRGADADVSLSMVRDSFGEFVVVGRYTAWDLWRYALGADLQEVDRRLDFGQGGRRGDAIYGRQVATADGRTFLAGSVLEIQGRDTLQSLQSLTPPVSDAVVAHKGRVFVIGADENAAVMRLYEIGCAP
ncbi:MAG: putative metal-binding motif-containing protein [Deltaproteobacteria bacterium]|nr:putative metal-binding motif-containing protein [Deltaproteobacteria bacterium]